MLRLTERTRRVRLLLVVLLLASLALVTIDFRSDGDGPLTKVGNAVASVLGPLQEAVASIARPIGNFFSGFGQVGSLKGRVRSLEEQLASLQQDQGRALEVLRQNDELRSILGMKDRLGLRTKAAEVIGRGPSNFEQAIVIDLGADDGIRRDMAVVAGEGLVGRVVSVTGGTAKVRLIIDPESSVAVRLAANGEVGTLDGSGRRAMRLQLLDPNAVVTAGDTVVTSGESGIFPPAIPVGTISSVAAPGGSVTRHATVEAAVDFTSLDFVLVVVDPNAADRPDPTPTPTVASPSPGGSPSVSGSPRPATASPRPAASRTASVSPSPGASR